MLLVAADPREFGGILRRCASPLPAKLSTGWARRGRLGNHDVLLAANGAGRVRAAAAVDAGCRSFTPEAVVSTGLCGALDPSLVAAEIVIATCVMDGERQFAAGEISGEHETRRGAVYTLDRVAQTSGEKAELRKTGASVVEMEAAGVAEESRRRGLPFFCVRAVSDLAEESFVNDWNASLRKDGHFDTMLILRGSLRRPWLRLPELVRMRNRLVRAARALGDFFADCRF
jgi:nucleoside phosphorylase